MANLVLPMLDCISQHSLVSLFTGSVDWSWWELEGLMFNCLSTLQGNKHLWLKGLFVPLCNLETFITRLHRKNRSYAEATVSSLPKFLPASSHFAGNWLHSKFISGKFWKSLEVFFPGKTIVFSSLPKQYFFKQVIQISKLFLSCFELVFK